jgi:uncharacterized protein YfaS (alpha-2-macroglobulin family)
MQFSDVVGSFELPAVLTAGDTFRLQVLAHDPENDPVIYDLFIAPIPGAGLASAAITTRFNLGDA